MILYNLFYISGMFLAVELVVSHYERNKSLIVSNTLNDRFKVLLKLIVWEINSAQVVVATNDFLADNLCRFWAHTLVSEADSIFALMKHHLSYKSLLLLLYFGFDF